MSRPFQMTVARQMGQGLCVLLLIVASLAALSFWGQHRAQAALKIVYEDRAAPMAELAAVQFLAARDRLNLMDALQSGQASVVEKRSREFASNRLASAAHWKAYGAGFRRREDAQLATVTEAALNALVQEGLVPLQMALDAGQFEAARTVLDRQVGRLAPAFTERMGELLKLQLSPAAAEFREQQARDRKLDAAVTGLSLAGLLLALGTALQFTVGLLRRLDAEPEMAAPPREIRLRNFS